jgi:hypothetical protein
MAKVAVLVLSDADTREGLGRVVNAMIATKEFKDAEDEVRLVFDGAGTKWVGELAKPDHRYHEPFEAVRGQIAGACGYCAQAYGAEQDVHREQIALLEEYEHHPSLRRLVADGSRCSPSSRRRGVLRSSERTRDRGVAPWPLQDRRMIVWLTPRDAGRRRPG